MSTTAIEMAIRDMTTDQKTIAAIIKDKEEQLSQLSNKSSDDFVRGLMKGSIFSLKNCLKRVTENIDNITKQYALEQDDDE